MSMMHRYTAVTIMYFTVFVVQSMPACIPNSCPLERKDKTLLRCVAVADLVVTVYTYSIVHLHRPPFRPTACYIRLS